jgi:hypothetical protein
VHKKIIYPIFFCFIFVFSHCFKFEEIPDKIGLDIDSVRVNGDTIFIKSKVSFASNRISEYGHCWSEMPLIPTLSNANYTCNGPLINSEYFEEKIIAKKGFFFIRAFIINDKVVEYSELEYVKIYTD